MRLSQYVPTEGEPGPVHVELQDQHRTLALLTPLETVNLARALLNAAERALS